MSKKLWGGRFEGKPNEILEAFSQSLSFDQQLWKEDLQVLKAHVSMLSKTGIIQKPIGEKLIGALAQIEKEIESGKLSISGDHEDIHSFIEAEVQKRVGESASLMRIARSRNDTVITDVRLHLKKALQELEKLHHAYLEAWVNLAEREKEKIVPGYTHFRRAQPMLFPFYCLAHISEGMREREALDMTFKWTDVSTLGAGALAGTTWQIEPETVARELGFSSTFFNALDATSDRDFILAFYFVSTLILTHISRWCEDFILWSSEGVGYLHLPDALCTGSSLMPQKKNPDPLELLRGKSARMLGNLSSLFVLMKGLPSGYNRDLQEDKEALFGAIDTMKISLAMAAEILKGVSLKGDALAKISKDDFLLATDLADELVKQGRSFAEAHEMSGKVVRYCEENGKSIGELSVPDWKKLVPEINEEMLSHLVFEKSAKRRESPGGTGEKAVAKQLAQAKSWLKSKTA